MGREGDFTPKVKLQAWKASNGHCKLCGSYIAGKVPHYDHVTPLWLWPPDEIHKANDLSNCQVLCGPCHRVKTGEEAPVRARANRQGFKNAHISTKNKRPMAGSRGSKWKRKMNGTVVER